MKIGRLLLRVLVGGFFVGHGTQKLFGWFGGHGLEGTAQGFEQIGLRPGKAHATQPAWPRPAAARLLALGFETPLAAAVITATMLTAIKTVHAKNGPWASNGGYEYNAVLIAVVLALAELGPGRCRSTPRAGASAGRRLGAGGGRRGRDRRGRRALRGRLAAAAGGRRLDERLLAERGRAAGARRGDDVAAQSRKLTNRAGGSRSGVRCSCTGVPR